MELVFILTAFVIGIVGGFFIGNSSNDAAKKLEDELKGVQEELNQYRTEVTSHFSKTAELFNSITANYRALYQHLADGAQKLCAVDAQLLGSMPKLEPLTAPIEGQAKAARPQAAGEPAAAEAVPAEQQEAAGTAEASSEKGAAPEADQEAVAESKPAEAAKGPQPARRRRATALLPFRVVSLQAPPKARPRKKPPRQRRCRRQALRARSSRPKLPQQLLRARRTAVMRLTVKVKRLPPNWPPAAWNAVWSRRPKSVCTETEGLALPSPKLSLFKGGGRHTPPVSCGNPAWVIFRQS